jgi:hypothetical protein
MCFDSCNWIVNFYPPTPIMKVEQLAFILPHKGGGIVVDLTPK